MTVYKRSNRIYYTPAQVTVLLNGYLVDDACAISYDVLDNWTPHFGHNDRLLRTYSMGQTIVQGELVVKFRYHGYLKRVITAITDQNSKLAGSPEQIAAMRKQQGVLTISNFVLQQDTEAVLSYLDAAGENGAASHKKAADFLKARFWGDSGSAAARDIMESEINGIDGGESQEDRDDRRAYQEYMRPSLARERHLRLRVVHGPETNVGKRAYAEVLEQVQFRGKSYKANIDVPDGERIVAEVYPFWARELRPV